MEGVTRAGLLVKPKSAFARDGKTKLRPEIVEERHKAHLAEQGENARVVLETRAGLVLKQQQKEQAQREIRATAREERRKARRQARRREMEEQGQQYDSDEFEVDEGADTVTEAESIRDAEDARALKMEDEDRKFAEKRVGSSAGNWILDCLARFGGGGGGGGRLQLLNGLLRGRAAQVAIAKAKMARAAEARRAQAEAVAEALAEQTEQQEAAWVAEEAKKRTLIAQRYARQQAKIERDEEKAAAEVSRELRRRPCAHTQAACTREAQHVRSAAMLAGTAAVGGGAGTAVEGAGVGARRGAAPGQGGRVPRAKAALRQEARGQNAVCTRGADCRRHPNPPPPRAFQTAPKQSSPRGCDHL
eukprot:SAG25_NODE_385_length_8737_cov_82.994675_9_plen_361_part_00